MSVVFSFICEFCLNKFGDKTHAVEVNFREQTLYTVCPHCKKDNELKFKTENRKPLPKIRFSK